MDDTELINEQFEKYLILFTSEVNAHAYHSMHTKQQRTKIVKRSHGSLLLYLNLLKSKTKCMKMYKKKFDEQQFISYKSCMNALNRATEKAKQNYNCNAITSIQMIQEKFGK